MSNPEIPSFKNPKGGGTPPQGESQPKDAAPSAPEKKEEKKGSGVPMFSKPASAAKIPLVGSTPAPGPSLKVRGLAGGPKTLLERLKQFQKKDLVFIASGMGVLFMAPLAEHFMMSPSQGKSLTGGFDDKTGGGPFGGGVGPQEVGTGLMAPGGLIGGSADVITPLNVRDPSALVMAPGASQVQPPPSATTVAPPAASSSRENGWKDALSGAAKAGVEKGADAAKPGAFRAPGSIAGALRGLSALSGGSYGGGPSFNLDKPNASNVPNRSGEGGRLSQVKSSPGYRGVGARGLDGGGGAEALRRAAEGQGNLFNRPGGAAGSLEAAAKEAIPVGGGSGGAGPGSGGENKGASGNNSKDNKALGESLAYLRMKMEMEKELDLKWSKKKWKEFEFPKMIYEEITKSAIQNIVGKGLFEPLGKGIAGMISGASSKPSGVICDGDEIAGNDKMRFYCEGGSGTNRRWIGRSLNDKGDDEGAPTYGPGTGVCKLCTDFGGAASKGASESTGNQDRQPQTGAPSAQDPGRQREQLGRSRSALEGFVNGDDCKKTTDKCPAVIKQAAEKILEEYKNIDRASQLRDDASATLKNRAWPAMQSAVKRLGDATGHMQDAMTAFGKAADTEEGNSVLSHGMRVSKKLKDEVDPKIDIPETPPTPHPAQEALTAAVQDIKAAKVRWGEGEALLVQARDNDGFQAISQEIGNAKGALDTADGLARDSGKLLAETNGRINTISQGEASRGPTGVQLGNFIETAKAEITSARRPLATLAGAAVAENTGAEVGGQLRDARSALEQRVLGARDSVCGALCGNLQAPKSGLNPPPPQRGKDAYAVTRAAADGGVGKIGGQAKQGDPPITIPEAVAGYKQTGKANETRLNNAIAGAKTPDQLQAADKAIADADKFLKTNAGCVVSSNCGYVGGGAGGGGGATVTGAAVDNITGDGLFEPLGRGIEGQISGSGDHGHGDPAPK